ncbi:hypothetical protein BDY24DRAFT_382124 [Mrakia frigida]|uniref:uncharacterized protein n=1 Tax=Mrakia frigida TaxID=29902 RepID=UPI003FCC04FA
MLATSTAGAGGGVGERLKPFSLVSSSFGGSSTSPTKETKPKTNYFASPTASVEGPLKVGGNLSPEVKRLPNNDDGTSPPPKNSPFNFTSPSKYSNHILPAVPTSPFAFSASSTPLASTKPSSTAISSPSPFAQPSTPIFKSPSQSLTSPAQLISFGSSPKPLSQRRLLGMMDLLGDDEDVEGTCGRHETITAPIFSHDALETYSEEVQQRDFPQYGLFGRLLETHSRVHAKKPESPFLYLNSNTPLSAVICGVQGSGKSHSVSLLLETMFIKDKRLGRLKNPVAGVVFHFGEGGAASQPCEAAWIASCSDPEIRLPKVVVYVSPSSFVTMKAVYSQIPNVSIYPLYLSEKELNSKSMLAMLGVGSGEPPLYISIIKNILQGLGEDFSYSRFLAQLEIRKTSFNPAQLAGLEQRMALLDSFLDDRAPSKGHACQQARITARRLPKFAKGQLTILDLSDPFIDASQACSLFEISLGQFIRAKADGAGKVCLLDEAHKYLDGSDGSSGSSRLTESLLSVVRQQRHLGLRVILATQEPTVVAPALLALTSIIVLHRFSSLAWWKHLTHHLGSELDNDAFDKVVTLKTGTSLIICPSALGKLQDVAVASKGKGGIIMPEPDEQKAQFVFGAAAVGQKEKGKVGQLGRGWMLVKGRKRLTVDGGKSVLAV